ncbi:MAG: response regulator [Acidimicrobiia bacterium]|nr:response regulator [Acidimicrobiia bacterium]RZV42051.1 MAG: response regulator transcription factor [Acidimicrobiales bacterium]
MTSAGNGRFGVIVADDDVAVCEALGSLIDDHPDLSLLGTAHSGNEAARLAELTHADLVVADVMMPTGGLEAIRAVHAVAPLTVVAVFTASRSRLLHRALVEGGAAAVFAKGEAIDLANSLVTLMSERRITD